MTPKTGLICVLWVAALYGSLSIATLPGDWGHSVCGVWGCGPPTQALVGCHLAWAVVLLPLSVIVSSTTCFATCSARKLGKLLCLTAVLLLVSVVLYQRATWWSLASDWQRGFFWHRCGFVVVTSVEIPMLQLFVAGMILVSRTRRPAPTPKADLFAPEATEQVDSADPV